MTHHTNPVIHFEMPAENRTRMRDFYTKAFGWKTEQLGPEMQEYVTVTTGETGSDGMPKNPGQINGGFYQKTEDAPHPSVVIGVEDIEAQVQKVTENGGTMVTDIMEIPGVGKFATFTDTEGNRVSMMQPARM
jgi:uncharacterized protein